MAAYPFTTFGKESTVEDTDGRLVRRASNGSVKVRVPYSADKKRFNLVHRLKSSEMTTLANFYGTNRAVTWTLVFDGSTSTCVFARPVQRKPLPGTLYQVNVYAEEV